MKQATLLIRADANVAIGTGHVMRCIALAQAWQDAGGRAMFAMAETTPSIESRLLRERMYLERFCAEPGTEQDWERTNHIAEEGKADWIVVDGYRFDANYQLEVTNSTCKSLFVDDNGHAGTYTADLVLNQNSHASESLYISRGYSTRLLLGPRYAMLRREFWGWREWRREIRETANRILIVMGGSDPDNFTTRVILALEHVRQLSLEVVAVVGGSNPYLAEIKAATANSRHRISVTRDATDMPGLMAHADIAISAAGSICWEFCALGLPVLLIPVAPNQSAATTSLESLGAAKLVCGGTRFCAQELADKVIALLTSASERQSLSERAHALVDGQGSNRVVAILRNGSAERAKQ